VNPREGASEFAALIAPSHAGGRRTTDLGMRDDEPLESNVRG